jgi:CTP-dependent riboflavin kinase
MLVLINRLTNSRVDAKLAEAEVVRQSGMDQEAAQRAFEHLIARNWIVREASFNENMIRITATGVEEAERIAMPFWRRWLGYTAIQAAIVSVILTFVLQFILSMLGVK